MIYHCASGWLTRWLFLYLAVCLSLSVSVSIYSSHCFLDFYFVFVSHCASLYSFLFDVLYRFPALYFCRSFFLSLSLSVCLCLYVCLSVSFYVRLINLPVSQSIASSLSLNSSCSLSSCMGSHC